ncbi:uncharacterized protein Dmoj_GI26144 [Drosophila mojavensis]|uniref:Uncharacterized protein n=1 Tax=Drosophila mojavensis TaxID=7230 RepID=A0A0Q9XB91_DROMO|nr:uncharacterized protein Dmoj_GI26144 [Drosophila mojavensis]
MRSAATSTSQHPLGWSTFEVTFFSYVPDFVGSRRASFSRAPQQNIADSSQLNIFHKAPPYGAVDVLPTGQNAFDNIFYYT